MSHRPLVTLSHVSASGRIDSWWEFLPGACRPARILARVILGGAPFVEIDVEVCAAARPRPLAFVIVRLGEDSWQLTPLRWPLDAHRVAHGEAFYEGWPIGAIDLIRAPESQQIELSAL